MSKLPLFSRKKDINVFFNTLNSRVQEYFSNNNVKRTGNWKIFLKTIVMSVLYFGTYAVLISFDLNGWIQILLVILMGIGMAGMGMNVMHDANHGAYSSKKWVNQLMGGTMYLLSGNVFNWKVQHNILHHTYTNIHGYDEDLDAGKVIRFSKFSNYYWINKFQHYYSFFLYGFLTLNWCVATDYRQSFSYLKRRLSPGARPNIFKHWAILIFTKIIYFSMWLVIPMILMENPWWQILIGFVLMHYVSGIILSVVFQLAHVVEDTDTFENNEKTMSNSWAVHQLYTTTNFATKNTFLNWFTGGLNHQIEHHLFPNINHIHYSKISSIVKKTIKDFKLPYHEYKTMLEALKSHYRQIKKMANKNFVVTS